MHGFLCCGKYKCKKKKILINKEKMNIVGICLKRIEL